MTYWTHPIYRQPQRKRSHKIGTWDLSDPADVQLIAEYERKRAEEIQQFGIRARDGHIVDSRAFDTSAAFGGTNPQKDK